MTQSPPPSICGTFVTDKRSLIGLTWTITCVLTLMALITCTVYVIHIHTYYLRLEHGMYETWYSNYLSYQQAQQEAQYNYNNNEEGGDNQQQQQQQQHSNDRDYDEFQFNYNTMRSGSMTIVSIYIILIATTIICYGSTAIIGFTSLRGIYIAPCFSSNDPATLSLKLGIFGGAIVFFANLLLICAVIFGEVRVEDWRNNQKDEHEQNNNEQQQQNYEIPYEMEQIATVLAVTCMFLAALYSIFAILLFLYFGSKEHMVDDTDEINIVSMQPTGHHVVVDNYHHPQQQHRSSSNNNNNNNMNHRHVHTTPGGTLSGGISMVDPRREKFITINNNSNVNTNSNNNDTNDVNGGVGVGQYELT